MIANEENLPSDWVFHFETGRLCLDFTSTVGDRSRLAFDRWRGADDLSRWCVEAGLLHKAPTISAAQLEKARDLREAIYRVVSDIHARRAARPRDIRLLNVWAARAPLAPQLVERGRAVTWKASAPLEAILATVARDAIDLVSSTEIDKLRECAESTCSVLFVDLSRPGKQVLN